MYRLITFICEKKESEVFLCSTTLLTIVTSHDPSFIYSWSISNYWEHEFYYLARAILRYTLYNVILCISRNFLETRENIKILAHPYKFELIFMGIKHFLFFFEKRIQNGQLEETEIFKIANSQNYFAKISQIGPWVSRIDWCQGHKCFPWFPGNFLLCAI